MTAANAAAAAAANCSKELSAHPTPQRSRDRASEQANGLLIEKPEAVKTEIEPEPELETGNQVPYTGQSSGGHLVPPLVL